MDGLMWTSVHGFSMDYSLASHTQYLASSRMSTVEVVTMYVCDRGGAYLMSVPVYPFTLHIIVVVCNPYLGVFSFLHLCLQEAYF